MAAPRRKNAADVGSAGKFIRQQRQSNAASKYQDKETSDVNATYLTDRFWIALISSCLLLFIIVHVQYHIFPSPITIPGNQEDAQFLKDGVTFVEEHARIVLDELCAHGTRHLGSYQNEKIAPEYFAQQVGKIQENANPVNSVELDVQTTTGCFDLDFIGHFTTCYTNVKNVLVRLASSAGATSGILVNCHYDTAVSSPGASDDLASCAIMLETLRVLSQSSQPLKHSVIFNFNGGEESILQASHGFITQHKWAAELKAFINLEAAGSGGRELVFQTGPENPWLISAYAHSAKYPFASVMGQEVFQSGVIPSDTDFRIYRDYGNLPGIDIAYTYNGYIYHTIYDQPKYIPDGCLQRGGDNLIALLKTMGNAEEVVDPGDSRLGKMVFFDVLGYFMIYYPEKLGKIINCTVILAVLFNLYRKLKFFQRQGMQPVRYLRLLLASWSIHAVSFVAMALVMIILSLQNDLIKPMMWYTNSWMIVPMYCLPSISTCILIHGQGKVYYNNLFQLASVWHLESIFFESAILFWTILLALFTALNLGSAYVFMLLVAFPLFIRQIIVDWFNISMKDSPRLYVSLTLSSLFVPALHIMQMIYSLFIMFVPLMGRVGSEVIPDTVISAFALLPVAVFSFNLASFFHVSKDQKMLAVKLLFLSLILTLIGWFTSLGFPYSGNEVAPSAQRHVLHHYSSEFYNKAGLLEESDSGLMYLSFDRNGARHLQSQPVFANLTLRKCDYDKAYCGLPYYYPMIALLKKVYTTDLLGKPNIQNRMKVSHTRGEITGDVHRHLFTTSGAHVHVNVYVMVTNGAELVGWSVTPGKPIPTRMPADVKDLNYFIYTTSAQTSQPDRLFWFDVKMPSNYDPSLTYLNIGFSTHDLDGVDSLTPEMDSLMSSLPDWTIPIGWTVTLQHYKI